MIPADMVVRGGGSSRGQKSLDRLISLRLGVSRGPRDLRSRDRTQVLVGKGGTGHRALPWSETRRRMACGTAAWIGRVRPGSTRFPNLMVATGHDPRSGG